MPPLPSNYRRPDRLENLPACPRSQPRCGIHAGATSPPSTSFGVLIPVVLIAVSGCATVDWGAGNTVREDRAREISIILQKTQADPIHGCDITLPKAIAGGRFGDSSFFGYDELTLLRRTRQAACTCKKRLFAVSEVPPASLDDVQRMTLADLVAIENSPNQPPAVEREVLESLRQRIPVAGPDEIATLYEGDLASLLTDHPPSLKFHPHDVTCDLPLRSPYNGYLETYRTNVHVTLNPTVKQMIADRTRALEQSATTEAAETQRREMAKQRAAKARLAAEAQEAASTASAEREGRAVEIRDHIALATKLARKDDLDGAEHEMEQAKALRAIDDQTLQEEGDQALLAEIAAADAAIAATPKAKRRTKEREREEARLQREAEKRDREEKRKEDASGRQVIGLILAYTDRIERDMRRLVHLFATLHPPAREPTRAEKEIVYAPMRQLCTTITAMRMQIPDDAEEQVLHLVYARFARTEGSRDANTAMGILAQYLEGDCHKTYQAAFSHQ